VGAEEGWGDLKEKKMKAGTINIAEELILNYLQFPRANILDVKFEGNKRTLELTIEDQEMPEVKDGHIETVSPMYVTYQNCSGDKVVIRQPLKA
jgi:hypothetical protein